MKQQTATVLIVIASILGLVVGGLLALFTFARYGPEQVVLMFILAAFILGGGAFALNPLFKSRAAAPTRLIEDMQIMMQSNPAHRVNVEEVTNLKDMAEAINAFADRYQTALSDQEAQIAQANASLEDERNKLGTLIAQLNEGVLVCNATGRILLYNPPARQLLAQEEAGYVGLGRSIFGVIDRNAITYALNRAKRHLTIDSNPVPVQFVGALSGGQLVQAQLNPILDRQAEMTGFILTLADVTQHGRSSGRLYGLVSQLAQQAEETASHVLAGITALQGLPEPDAEQRSTLYQQILQAAVGLQTTLTETSDQYDKELNIFDWRLEDVLVQDLLLALEDQLPVPAKIDTSATPPLWVRVDSYALVASVSQVFERLQPERKISEVLLHVASTDTQATLEIIWVDALPSTPDFEAWEETLIAGIGLNPVPLKLVIEVLKGRIEWQAKPGGKIHLQLWLPVIQPPVVSEPTASQIAASGRELPAYDFALLQQHDPDPELEQRSLSELMYTVFDTETTGLEPSSGDEIISVGAVRIVNGRLLRQEVFDRLVDPQRKLSAEATRITGISSDMLNGQPLIGSVLPEFFEFTRETVLVAHNAAFDMRFLQLKEAATGVKFKQPVLDTLLLAAIVNPTHKDYSLEMLAQRLGITVVARHSSLGDALVTGEILLKLIPLLAEKGITTLAQAQQASKENYLAQVSY